jgi:phosphoribosylglycinamide formyltransferase 1
VTRAPLNVAVFASGGGTNFQALLDHQERQTLWRVALLIVNREAGAAARAEAADVPVRLIATRDRDEGEVASEMLGALDEHGIDVILLAGYLRRIPTEVVARYRGRILNIHPALLPDFGGAGMYGMNVHRAVVASEAEASGATVHFVDEEYDDGAILGQWSVERLPGDTAEALAARVLRVEHELYPRAVDHLCAALSEGRAPERMKSVRLDEPPEQGRPRTASSASPAPTTASDPSPSKERHTE